MQHPTVGPNGFELVSLVYPGSVGEIAVGLMKKEGRTMMALRWCPGNENISTYPGTETGWFLVPFTFASAIGRALAQLHATGHAGINVDGFAAMAKWLIENEGLDDAMCY
ncbi:MAG: hypothetical protein U1E05_09540 [Patescibacteria group bacterium]|nr:hypothetical protein [Patescibacteria group bacterium]